MTYINNILLLTTALLGLSYTSLINCTNNNSNQSVTSANHEMVSHNFATTYQEALNYDINFMTNEAVKSYLFINQWDYSMTQQVQNYIDKIRIKQNNLIDFKLIVEDLNQVKKEKSKKYPRVAILKNLDKKIVTTLFTMIEKVGYLWKYQVEKKQNWFNSIYKNNKETVKNIFTTKLNSMLNILKNNSRAFKEVDWLIKQINPNLWNSLLARNTFLDRSIIEQSIYHQYAKISWIFKLLDETVKEMKQQNNSTTKNNQNKIIPEFNPKTLIDQIDFIILCSPRKDQVQTNIMSQFNIKTSYDSTSTTQSNHINSSKSKINHSHDETKEDYTENNNNSNKKKNKKNNNTILGGELNQSKLLHNQQLTVTQNEKASIIFKDLPVDINVQNKIELKNSFLEYLGHLPALKLVNSLYCDQLKGIDPFSHLLARLYHLRKREVTYNSQYNLTTEKQYLKYDQSNNLLVVSYSSSKKQSSRPNFSRMELTSEKKPANKVIDLTTPIGPIAVFYSSYNYQYSKHIRHPNYQDQREPTIILDHLSRKKNIAGLWPYYALSTSGLIKTIFVLTDDNDDYLYLLNTKTDNMNKAYIIENVWLYNRTNIQKVAKFCSLYLMSSGAKIMNNTLQVPYIIQHY